MRSHSPFPLCLPNPMIDVLKAAWSSGWLDGYSDEHFLIRAIENQLADFVGKDQFVNNNSYFGMLDVRKGVDMSLFSENFCINFNSRLKLFRNAFGESGLEQFIKGQLSAGNGNYNEDSFFEALSEVSVLSFFASRASKYMQAQYEPPVQRGANNHNPEASFIYRFPAGGFNPTGNFKVNVEVKSPAFPHDSHSNEKIAIPSILLTEDGRKIVKAYCEEHGVKYLDPRALKLRDFLSSAAEKFAIPQANEFNLLYINWSFRDFPSKSFLEPWSLLTNEINGILSHPQCAQSLNRGNKRENIQADAFQKISAVIVYTETLEGLMFHDFRYVWQGRGNGPYFRMWVLDEQLRKAEQTGRSDILFRLTGMRPSNPGTERLLLDYKSETDDEKLEAIHFAIELKRRIEENAYQA